MIITAATSSVHAQTDYNTWNLNIEVTNIPWGTGSEAVSVDGPYGDHTGTTISSQTPSTIFNLDSNQFPAGTQFKVCAGSGILGSILNKCQFFTHSTDGDQSITISSNSPMKDCSINCEINDNFWHRL